MRIASEHHHHQHHTSSGPAGCGPCTWSPDGAVRVKRGKTAAAAHAAAAPAHAAAASAARSDFSDKRFGACTVQLIIDHGQLLLLMLPHFMEIISIFSLSIGLALIPVGFQTTLVGTLWDASQIFCRLWSLGLQTPDRRVRQCEGKKVSMTC